MPMLETSDKIAPRSALRHRPIAEDATRLGKRSIANPITPVAQRAHRPRPVPTSADVDTQVEVDEWQQGGDDEENTIPTIKQRISTQPKPFPTTPRPRAIATRWAFLRQAHPLLYLGIGMLVMLTLWVAIMGVGNWVTTTMDNLHYGYPRTYQVDAFVGHNEASGTPSHFIAINLHGHIEVIELPGGDASHARIYVGPQLFGAGSDLVPVTLSFKDVNGDHKPDMIINVQGSQIVYINDNGGFRPLLPTEHR